MLLKEATRYKAGTAHLSVGGRGAGGGGRGEEQGAGYRPLRSLGGQRGVHPMMRNLAADEVRVLGSDS